MIIPGLDMKSEKSRGDRMLEVGHLHRVTVFIATQQLKNRKYLRTFLEEKYLIACSLQFVRFLKSLNISSEYDSYFSNKPSLKFMLYLLTRQSLENI